MATLSLGVLPNTPVQSPKTLTPLCSLPSASLSFLSSAPSRRITLRTASFPALRALTDGGHSSKRGSSNAEWETIMLPGCDYNHWLVVLEFPKDPAPTREQLIETYTSTLLLMFLGGLPGVLWVLPDSYIDVKNKDYGGDKYMER